jgi:hypothetical protein
VAERQSSRASESARTVSPVLGCGFSKAIITPKPSDCDSLLRPLPARIFIINLEFCSLRQPDSLCQSANTDEKCFDHSAKAERIDTTVAIRSPESNWRDQAARSLFPPIERTSLQLPTKTGHFKAVFQCFSRVRSTVSIRVYGTGDGNRTHVRSLGSLF